MAWKKDCKNLRRNAYHPCRVGLSRRLLQTYITELLKAEIKVVHGWGVRVTSSSESGCSRVPARFHVANSAAALLTWSLLMQDLALHKTELQHLQNINFITPVSRASVKVYEAY